MEKSVKTSEATVYRKVEDETVVVQLDTGEINYFSPQTFEFLDSLKTPKRVTMPSESDQAESDQKKLAEFCQILLEKQILVEADSLNEPQFSQPFSMESLKFLRKDEKTIDDIAFLCP